MVIPETFGMIKDLLCRSFAQQSKNRCQFHQHFTSSFLYKNLFLAAFLYLHFRFVLFGRKEIGTKAACKMTTGHSCGIVSWDDPLTGDENRFVVVAAGVNSTNILRATFTYKNVLCCFYVLTVRVCNFWEKGNRH